MVRATFETKRRAATPLQIATSQAPRNDRAGGVGGRRGGAVEMINSYGVALLEDSSLMKLVKTFPECP